MRRRARVLLAAVAVALAVVLGAADAASPQPSPRLRGRLETLVPGPLVVSFVGDISPEPADPRTFDVATAQLAQQLNPVVHLLGGDLQYEDATLEKFTSPTGYAASWGQAAILERSCPAPGNHEYQHPAPGAPGFYTYFADRLQACALGPGSRPDVGFYSFDLANGWHVVALNSDCRRTGEPSPHCTSGGAMVQWLRADLARVRDRQRCTAVFFHHPRWGSGYFPDDGRLATIWSVLQAERVDVVLNGHEHHYARYGPMRADGSVSASGQGTRQLTVGTGGRSINPFRRPPHQPGLRFREARRFGVLRLVLTGAAGGRGSWASQWRTLDGARVDPATAGCWL